MNMPNDQTDIFGQPQTGPDISSEALQWEPDDSFDAIANHGDEEPLHSDEENTDGETEDDDIDEGADEEAGEDPDDSAENAGFEVPDHLKALTGKTPEELLRITVDSQSMVARQAAEIGELRKAVEAIRLQAEQQGYEEPEMAPAAEYIHSEQDGIHAYREAIDMLDRGEIGPNAIDDIIDVVREISPFTAAKMDRDFGMRLARAEMNAHMAPVIQQSYQDALRQATYQMNQDPDAEAYREDIVRIVQQPATLVEQQVAYAFQQARTASDLHGSLAAALQIARGANPVKASAFKAAQQASKKNEAVESGNSAPPPKAMTEEERVISSFLKPAKAGADLFAGFGGN